YTPSKKSTACRIPAPQRPACFKDVRNYFAVLVGVGDVPALHDPFGCNYCFIECKVVMAFASAPEKRRDVTPLIAAAKDNRKCISNGRGIEHGIDATLCVISHHQPAELQSCLYKPAFRMIPDFHRVVIVLHIRRIRIGAKVTPFTEYRVTHEAVV